VLSSELQCVAVVSELREGERDKASIERRKLHVVSSNIRNVLQHVAACCSMLQHVAVCFSVPQCFVVCCSVLSESFPEICAVCCSVCNVCSGLQCAAACCSVLQRVAVVYHVSKYVILSESFPAIYAVCCNIWQHVAVC